MQDLLEDAQNNTIEPMLYKLPIDRKTPTYENTLPIRMKIYVIANMEVFGFHRKVEELNPECELVGVKTDCLV